MGIYIYENSFLQQNRKWTKGLVETGDSNLSEKRGNPKMEEKKKLKTFRSFNQSLLMAD